MELTLTRTETDDMGTKGVLTDSKGKTICLTLELPDRNNKKQFSCIPIGKYEVIKHLSPSKGECFKLLNVLSREHILIHTANFAGDTKQGYYSELLGCIAPVERFICVAPSEALKDNEKAKDFTTPQTMAIGSRNSFEKLKALVKYEKVAFGEKVFTLTIKN